MANLTTKILPAPYPRGRAEAIYIRPVAGVTKVWRMSERVFWFPVAPQELTVSGTGDWNESRIVGLGMVPHPIGPSLPQISFSSFFPASYSPALCWGLWEPGQFHTPAESVFLLEGLRDNTEVMWLVAGVDIGTRGFSLMAFADLEPQENTVFKETVRITSFSWSGAAGRPGDRLFEITFAGYQPSALKLAGGTRLTALPKTYQPSPGEDLKLVALRFYGNADMWKSVAKFNGLPVTSDNIPSKAGRPVVLKLPSDTQVKATPPTGRNPTTQTDRLRGRPATGAASTSAGVADARNAGRRRGD